MSAFEEIFHENLVVADGESEFTPPPFDERTDRAGAPKHPLARQEGCTSAFAQFRNGE
jgi:hypothetical protein